MPNIHVLDERLINKIAAGEVVERPAAVIKELIENSVDAGASRIHISMKDDDATDLRVEDNGAGMSREDALLSIERHATSKISEADDLFNISTLGFRGEALASIAAVSRMRVITKTAKNGIGIRLDVEGSKVMSVKEVPANHGTIIEVSSLFFNTPARKKYMCSLRQEQNIIIDIVTRYALCYSNIRFRLDIGKNNIINSQATGSLIDTIASIYGHDIAGSMIKVSHKGNACSVTGYVCKPSFARSDKTRQSVFINNRYVKSKPVSEGLYEGYHSMLFTKRHPVSVLFLDVSPQEVDVNVHPAKDIIRLEQESVIRDDVRKAVKTALEGADLSPSVCIDSYDNVKNTKLYAFNKDTQSVLVKESPDHNPSIAKKPLADENTPVPDVAGGSMFGAFRILGQVNLTYILAETPEGLMVIDQHAAEERVNYEHLLDEFRSKGVSTQKLFKPGIFETSAYETAVIKQNLGLLKRTGFHVEPYGTNTFIMRSIPAIFGRFYDGLFESLVHELDGMKTKVDEIKEERIIRFSCRKSIKAGKEMTQKEMNALLDALEKAKHPFTCPHGRPTMIKVTIGELEKKFKRTG